MGQHLHMDLRTIRRERAGDAVAVVTMDRPHRLNAWTGRMHTELRHVMAELEADEATRVVVVTGEGRGFCAGADSGALEGHAERGGYDPGTPDELAEPAAGAHRAFQADLAWLMGMSTVTIAAVNGPAAGVGFALASWCDLRVVAADAKLTTAHGRLALPAEFGLSWLLPRMVGLGAANDLLLSSRIVLGEEAARMGWAQRVVHDGGSVLDAATAWADELVRTVSPASLATTKRQIAMDQLHDDPARSVEHAGELLEAMMTTADYAEGVQALLRKGTPSWSDPPRPA